MEPPRLKKRKIEDMFKYSGNNYRFKILLPNGTSIGLTVREPERQIPFEDFIFLVKEEYIRARRVSETMRQKKDIQWRNEIYIEDANGTRIVGKINFQNFNPHKCHILRLYDQSSNTTDTFENMWDLTPDTELLACLPEEYTFETALADLIDNSLQAVWSNSTNQRKLISVDITENSITVFDTGPGMDDSDENSLVKWGKIGASVHRSFKVQGIGGNPPYLQPFFGMFGYGGPIASMHLGRRARVSSKTKDSKKVFSLDLVREALLSSSRSEVTWRTGGGIRSPLQDETEKSPHGSYTKVEIFEPKVKNVDILHLQCKLKDIYFPYIQCDEVSNSRKTITPIEFQVNDVALAEIEGGEVATSYLHSCNGPDFVVELQFFINQDSAATNSSPVSEVSRKANARLKFVYFPIVKGKESIEMILEKLEADGCGIRESYKTFSRVSIRRLGRLLPEARWPCLPIMEPKHKKKENSHLMKRCYLRVKCFIDTDAGFNPTTCKTDLAHHNPFTTALRNFGINPFDKNQETNVEIKKNGRILTMMKLEKEYHEWVLQMHRDYDKEINRVEDQPVLVVSPTNKKELGISSDVTVVRVHRVLKRKETFWKHGQKVKIIKGACAGFHKNNVHATLEYFVFEGFEGDAGGDARIICRPLDLSDETGCTLDVNDGNACLNLHSSLSLPISVIDSGKCVAVEKSEWEDQLEKKRQKTPSEIDLLTAEHCQEMDIVRALPVDNAIHAGYDPPPKIVAVVRPASFTSSASDKLDKKYVVNTKSEMSLEVKYIETEDSEDIDHIYSIRVSPSSHQDVQGLYIFPLRLQFHKAGVYIFVFSLQESNCKKCVKKVLVKPSSEVGTWKVLEQEPSYVARVGSAFPPFSVACYDIYGNRMPFSCTTKVMAELCMEKGVSLHINKLKVGFSSNNLILNVKDLVIESGNLDKIRPSYTANLAICSQDKLFSVSIPCQVTPGSLHRVTVLPPLLKNQLGPGVVISELLLEMFDQFDNHVAHGLEVELILDGFHIQDQLGTKCKVDGNGLIDLSGLLTVTGGYGKNVSLSVLSDKEVVFKQVFQIEERKLQLASTVPRNCIAGSQLEHVAFQVVNSAGVVDETIHDYKYGHSHTLTIRSESFNIDDSIRYAFRHGGCTVPAIPLPKDQGRFCFVAAHSRHPELHLTVKIHVMHAQELNHDNAQSPCTDEKIKILPDSSITHAGGIVEPVINNEGLEHEIIKLATLIGYQEKKVDELYELKADIDQNMHQLLASMEPCTLESLEYSREIMRREIESRSDSAAAVLCNLSRNVSVHEPRRYFMEDIIGVVGLLGTVCTAKFSRILAEYLGEEKMVAVVCRSYETANDLEKYTHNGEVDYEHALHAEASALRNTINGRFLLICLEDVRSYMGELEGDDPEWRLSLPDPTLHDGYMPLGFMGYAVNMVNIGIHHLHTRTSKGYGLRETLFYHLFGELQVYDTREHMIEARECLKHGAVSLDGGILRENGVVYLGYGNPKICFGVEPENQKSISSTDMQTWEKIEASKSKLKETMKMLAKEIKVHVKAVKKFEKKKRQYSQILDMAEKQRSL